MTAPIAISRRFFIALALVCAFSQSAHAEDKGLRKVFYGSWRDVATGDSYSFNRNKTYVFRAGAQKRKSGNLTHSGTWDVSKVDPYYADYAGGGFDPSRLRLIATHRQVLVRGQVVRRPASRVFELFCSRAFRDAPRNVVVYLSRNGRHYYREPGQPQNVHWLPSPTVPNPNQLYIGDAVFKRVK
jgi:hypothetical protein